MATHALRTHGKVAMMALAIVTSCVSLALVVLTSNIRRSGQVLRDSVASVHSVEEVKFELLELDRPRERIVLHDIENSLRGRLRDAQRYVSSPGEQTALEEATARVDAYLSALHDQGASRGDLSRLFAAGEDALTNLVNVNLAQADVAAREAKRWDGLANLIGFSAGVLMLALVGGLFVWFRRSILQPVFNLEAAMERFGTGMLGARVEGLETFGVAELETMGIRFNLMADALQTQQAQADEALKKANQRLVEVDQRRNEFLRMLSHELRNPLAPIRNSLYILDRSPPDGERARHALAVIDRQATHLTRLVEDLLDVTRVTTGKVRVQREMLDLNDLARRCVEDHRGAFVQHSVGLAVRAAPSEVWVNGDRTRLSQVIGNLLQNAVKFTSAGDRATVSVEADPTNGVAIVRVKDTGIGIAPEILPRLFEPFTQADATLSRTQGGLGLGLAVVKGLVEMHGGSVQGESEGLGKGATFTIALPLEATPMKEHPSRDLSGGGARHRVLVIEDNADAADTLKEVLELRGHEVSVAYTGRDGIEKAHAFKPDLVLCDIGLPEMDGYEVAKEMRANAELRVATLVALTGYAGPDDVAKATLAGFDGHLAKPPTIDALERTLREARH